MAVLTVRLTGVLILFPALGLHVEKVVALCSNEEVSWIAAGRSVAVVADVEAVGNGAIGEDVGTSVGEHGPLRLAGANIHSTVSPLIECAGETPAPIGSPVQPSPESGGVHSRKYS